MKTFFVVFGIVLAVVAWFTGIAVLCAWVEATFGGNWVAAPLFAGFAPVVAGVICFILEDV